MSRPCFLKWRWASSGDGLIHHRQQVGQGFEDGHLAAETGPDAAELEADDARADDAEPPRHGVEFEGVPRIDDVFSIVRSGRQTDGRRARRQHDMLRLQDLLRAIGRRHLHAVARQEPPVALDAHRAGGFQERGNAVGHGLDDGCAPLLHLRKIELDVADLDAMLRELVLRAVIQFGGLEQRLRWNTSGIEAGATKGVGAVGVLPLVHAGDRQLVLAGTNRRRIACRASADHDHVVVVAHTPSTMRAGSSRHCLTVTRNCTASRPSMMRWSYVSAMYIMGRTTTWPSTAIGRS